MQWWAGSVNAEAGSLFRRRDGLDRIMRFRLLHDWIPQPIPELTVPFMKCTDGCDVIPTLEQDVVQHRIRRHSIPEHNDEAKRSASYFKRKSAQSTLGLAPRSCLTRA